MFAGAAYALCSDDNTKVQPTNTTTSAKAVPLKGKFNILVLGVDEREDGFGRSDTTFVVTVDASSRQVSLLSIPRDTRVKITGHGWDKINHAYAFGGQPLSKATIEKLLGISIDYTVAINFNGFIRAIDALGGVTVNVEKRMYYADPYDDNGGLLIDLRPGVQRMNGKTAIEYVRYRDEEGDIGRVARQQAFLKDVLQELSNPQVIMKIPDLIREFRSAIKTDLPVTRMLEFAKIIHEAAQLGLQSEMVSGTPMYIQDISYWLPNIKELRETVARMQGLTVDTQYREATARMALEYENSVPRALKIAEPARVAKTLDKSAKLPLTAKAKVQIINASGQRGAEAKVATQLIGQGFEISEVTDANNLRRNTLILLRTADEAIVNKLNELPFKYSLQIDNGAAQNAQLTVIIGQDYKI
ncbi:MAG TPA: LCP family protein [Negativicutes bacterium]